MVRAGIQSYHLPRGRCHLPHGGGCWGKIVGVRAAESCATGGLPARVEMG